jgi:ABC-type phosphate transport system permease subunit
MLRLVKAFLDIALWRRTPAHLPASRLLLGLVALAAAALEVITAILAPESDQRIVARIVLSVGLPLAFAWAVLAVARHRERFLQTGSALLRVAVLTEILLYPIESLIHAVGDDRLVAVPLGVLLLVALVWYLLACANIWRCALDSRLGLGIAISVGYLVLSIVLEQQILKA